MTEETDMSEEERVNKLLMLHGDILVQLMAHERFKMFLTANYDIHLDEEKNVFVVREYTAEHARQNVLDTLEQQKNEKSPIITLDKG